MSASSGSRLALYGGLLALLPVLYWLGIRIVPAHWTSIWMDQEFSGWVAPISNRIARGQQLYADGGHTPMAPLPYVLLTWLGQGRALWITESEANYVCQGLAIITLFVGFHRVLPWPAPLISAFAVLINFVSLPKVILYDALAQLFAALVAVLAMHGICRSPEERASRVYLLLAGVASGLGLLAKQSTGAGVLFGVLLAVWLASRGGTVKQRLVRTGYYAGSAALSLALFLLMLAPWIEVGGFVSDVLLTSSEVKGGRLVLLRHLQSYAIHLWRTSLTIAVSPVAIAVALMAWRALSPRRADQGPQEATSWRQGPALVGVFLGSALSVAAVQRFALGYDDVTLQALLYVTVLFLLGARLRERPEPPWSHALSTFAIITFPAALAHSLSVDQFRWSYDNNPLVWVPVAFASSAAVLALGRRTRVVPTALAAAGLAFALQAVTIGGLAAQLARAKASSESWPEVRFLQGARLRPEAEGMRNLIAAVRRLAPQPDDAVLLLPNDPNVEAWFERPRPELTSTILFADQYWDRFVDEDFQRLKRKPPRAIVIGPRNFWRGFSHYWQPDKATERLGALVLEELIPERYTHALEVPIKFGAGDYMDIYVLEERVVQLNGPDSG